IGELGFVFFLLLGLFFRIVGQLRLLFFQLVEFLVEPGFLFSLLRGIERLAVFRQETADLVVADVKDVVLLHRGGLHFAMRIQIIFGFREVASVELAKLFERALIFVRIAQQRGNVGKRTRVFWRPQRGVIGSGNGGNRRRGRLPRGKRRPRRDC